VSQLEKWEATLPGQPPKPAGTTTHRPERVERMVFASGAPTVDSRGFVDASGRHVVYDNGFYNIGVRPRRTIWASAQTIRLAYHWLSPSSLSRAS